MASRTKWRAYSRQLGNSRENRLGELARAIGYVPFFSRGSRGIDCLLLPREKGENRPVCCVEVGNEGKHVGEAFALLRAAERPIGSVLIVAKEVKRKAGWEWRFFFDPDAPYSTTLIVAVVAAQKYDGNWMASEV